MHHDSDLLTEKAKTSYCSPTIQCTKISKKEYDIILYKKADTLNNLRYLLYITSLLI